MLLVVAHSVGPQAANRENDQLREKREQFASAVVSFQSKAKFIDELRQRQKEQLEYRGQELSSKIDNIKAKRDDMRQRWKEEILEKQAEKERKAAHMRSLVCKSRSADSVTVLSCGRLLDAEHFLSAA